MVYVQPPTGNPHIMVWIIALLLLGTSPGSFEDFGEEGDQSLECTHVHPLFGLRCNVFTRALSSNTNSDATNAATTETSAPSSSTVETTTTTVVNQQNPERNSSQPNDENILQVNGTTIIKNGDTVIIPKNCTKYPVINRLLYILNDSLTCEDMKDITITVKSKTVFDKINTFLKGENKNEDLDFIKFHTETFNFEIHPQTSFEGVFIPTFALIIIAVVVASTIMIVVIIVCCRKKFCCKKRSSHQLKAMPHINSIINFTLTPIPRPSLQETKRDFMNAYSQENYSREDNGLDKRYATGSMSKICERVEKGADKELKTFNQQPKNAHARSQNFASSRASVSEDYLAFHSWGKKIWIE